MSRGFLPEKDLASAGLSPKKVKIMDLFCKDLEERDQEQESHSLEQDLSLIPQLKSKVKD
jgi:hypothetical protein